MFHHKTLDNGLTLVGEYRESASCTALGFFVKTGARDETPEVSGVSHFLEHMMFKGTEKRSALDITYQMAAIGAQTNAYTSEENTVYYAYVLPEYFEEAFEILSDQMRPSLDENEFNTEKNVILEEIALYEDRPTFKLYEVSLEEHFKGHTAGNSVLGTTASVAAITAKQMREYFDCRYSPSNIVLSVSGKFDWERVCALAEAYCGSWEKKDADRMVKPHVPAPVERTCTKDNLQTAHVCMMAAGPSAADEDRYAAYVLSGILGDSSGSKAYWSLVDTGLAEGASVDADDMDGVGVIFAFASAAPDRLDEVTAKFKEILAKPLDFSDEDLKRAKTKLETRLVLQGESTSRRMMAVGLEWIYRQRYCTLEEEMAKFEAVTRADIERLVQRFPFTPTTTVRMIPS